MTINRNCKVLFVAPSAYSLGGVQTWLDYIVPGLAQQDADVTHFDTSIALTSGTHHNVDAYINEHPFKSVYRVDNPSGTIAGRVRALEKLITQISPDIVLVVNIADVYLAMHKLRQQGDTHTRVVMSLHGIHPGLIDDIDRYRHIIDAVVVSNKLTAKLVVEKTRFEAARVLYAPYGVPNTEDKVSQDENPRPFTVAYVGRIEEDQKRISDLIDIINRLVDTLPSVRVLIAGDGPEHDMLILRQWLDNLASSNVQYLGLLNSHELQQKVYAASDVLLLTSHWETGPIVAWEAFQHGLTLVSSKYIGHEEEGSLIDGKNCLLFELGDIDQAVNLLAAAQSNTLRMGLSRESKKLITTKYSRVSSVLEWHRQLRFTCSYPPKKFHPQNILQTDKSRLSNLLRKFVGDSADSLAEDIRHLLKRKFKHKSAGSEWPHSYSNINSASSGLNEYVSSEPDFSEP